MSSRFTRKISGPSKGLALKESFYNKNIGLLTKRYREIPELLSPVLSSLILPVNTGAENVSIRFSNTLIHSSYNPVREAEGFCNSLNITSGSHVLLYGFGMGYHVEAIAKEIGQSGSLLVVEANTALLSAAFILRDLSDILKNPIVHIISSKEQVSLAKKLSSFFSGKWSHIPDGKKKICIHMPSFDVIPLKFSSIKNSFDLLLMEQRYETVFMDIERENIVKNSAHIFENESGKKYFGMYNEKRGVLVAAGPSLSSNMHYLKKLKETDIMVCVDTSFPVLACEGVIPDFVVTVDPQEASFTHFISCLSLKVPLVMLPTASNKVVKHYKGEKIFLQQTNNIIKGAFPSVSVKGTPTEAGGSVSCIALDFLAKLGVNPIILIGQDCAFPDMRRYAKGTSEDKKLISSAVRLATKDMIDETIIADHECLWVLNKFNRKIPTHKTLYLYLRYIESIIEHNKDKRFYNLGSSGAKIKGARDVSSPCEIR